MIVKSIMKYGAQKVGNEKKSANNKMRAMKIEHWRKCYGVTRLNKMKIEEIIMQMDVIKYIEKERLMRCGRQVRRANASRCI